MRCLVRRRAQVPPLLVRVRSQVPARREWQITHFLPVAESARLLVQVAAHAQVEIGRTPTASVAPAQAATVSAKAVRANSVVIPVRHRASPQAVRSVRVVDVVLRLP